MISRFVSVYVFAVGMRPYNFVAEAIASRRMLFGVETRSSVRGSQMKNKTARLVGEVDMAGTSVSPELRAAVSPAELVGGLRRKKAQ